MRVLTGQPPTPEQLKIISEGRAGTDIIRGAAGSGKTHTAILRLETLTEIFRNRLTRLEQTRAVRVLVLTFNRTLCGYIESFSKSLEDIDVNIETETFARWAMNVVGEKDIVDSYDREQRILAYARDIDLPKDFLMSEIEYISGRFVDDNVGEYLHVRRDGRGASPRVDRALREKIIQCYRSYRASLFDDGLYDWEDLSQELLSANCEDYDIVIVDEAQDFSANQLRAVCKHLASTNFLTLILDTAQRLYPRGYTWAEIGLGGAYRTHKLAENHRNTREIAAFAAGVLEDVTVDADGVLPDLNAAKRTGPMPTVVKGLYRDQLNYALNYINEHIDLHTETVAFLKPRGGRWFEALSERLTAEQIAFEQISREREWPAEHVNVVISTMHSAKGLEFDHVFILGLTQSVTPHGAEEDDDMLLTLRRLLGVAVSRARKTVHLGFKENEKSDLVRFFKAGTFQELDFS